MTHCKVKKVGETSDLNKERDDNSSKEDILDNPRMGGNEENDTHLAKENLERNMELGEQKVDHADC